MRGFLLSYGPESIKKKLWDKEFSSGKWNFIDNTASDCVYLHLEKYARGGSILDLGCGPGNTANEVANEAYSSYVGLDISDEALAKAKQRTEAEGRSAKNSFAQADFLSFEPNQQFDVILFRESMYHIPFGKIRPILEKYSKHLKDTGVFIVRMYTLENGKAKYRPTKMLDLIASNFNVVERAQYNDSGAAVIVFRPRLAVAKELAHLESQRAG